MTTPETLRAEAERLERDVAAARARGDAHAMAVAAHQAHVCRLAADELEGLLKGRNVAPVTKPLRSPERKPIVNGQMFTDTHRLNMAKAQAKPGDELLAKAQAAGFPSLAALAAEVGVSRSLLTMARNKADPRPMPTRAAQKIQELTGYPVTRWARLS